MSVRNAGIKQASLGGTIDVLNNSSSFSSNEERLAPVRPALQHPNLKKYQRIEKEQNQRKSPSSER